MTKPETEQLLLMLIDVQGKLAEVVDRRERLYDRLSRLIRGLRALQAPVLWVEQNPQRMGPTIQIVRELLHNLTPLSKMSFSCCADADCMSAIESSGRRQVVLAGIETHVCIYQTARDLLAGGYAVYVAEDAVSSRDPDDKQYALQSLAAAGAGITTVERLLFELIGTAEHPAFREILQIVK
mgnify:CR=1 FL=1